MANTFPASGNTGIGTTTPGTDLEVYGADAEVLVHYISNSRGGLRAMSTQRVAILTTASSDNLVFGYETDIKSTFNERMRIVNSTGNVGINTTSPASLLHLAGGGTGTRGALRISEVGLTNYWELGRDNSVSGDFTINSNATERMRITTAGTVGIGTSSPGTYALNVNGTFYSAGSSLEYKTNITILDIDTDKLMKLRPVTYQYKDEYKHLGKDLKSGTQIGLIAEEVAEVFPELAMLKEDEDGKTRVRNVDYEKLSILLLSEVQKLRAEINELKNK